MQHALPHVQALTKTFNMASLNGSSTSAQEQRERNFKEDEREKKPIVPQKQLSKERLDWQDDEPVTGPGEQLGQKNKGKRVCNADVIG